MLRCSLSFFVVLSSFPSFLQVGLLCPLLLLGGVSLPLHSLDGVFVVGLLFPSLLLGGAAWPPSLGGVASGPSLLLRGAASLLLLWVGLLPLSSSLWVVLRLASFVGWCCVIPSLFAWCCLPSPPSLGGSLSKRKIKKIEKNEVKNKKIETKRNKEENKKKKPKKEKIKI